MKKKKMKKYVYEGFGFPVVLEDVPVINFHGQELPDIDLNMLQRYALMDLSIKKSPLTGNEIKFIRECFDLTPSEFGEIFGCSHVEVVKWEKVGNEFAKFKKT